MARYRVGDTYLSQAEYDAYRDHRFAFLAAFLSVLAAALLIRQYIEPYGFAKAVRFALVVAGSGLVGVTVFALRRFIRLLLKIIAFTWVLALVGHLVWTLV